MAEFFSTYWSQILLSVITGIISIVLKHYATKAKEFKKILEEKENEEIDKRIDQNLQPILTQLNNINAYIDAQIDQKLNPIAQKLEDLRVYIEQTNAEEASQLDFVKSFYRYEVLQLCHVVLEQEYITMEQYERLSELFRIYSGMGGNGQAKERYQLAIELPITSNKK